MSVFITEEKNEFGHVLTHRIVADRQWQLHDLGRQLGLTIKHLRFVGTLLEHYEVSYGYRERAIKRGAVDIPMDEFASIMLDPIRGDYFDPRIVGDVSNLLRSNAKASAR